LKVNTQNLDLWTSLKEALKGTEVDYTSLPLEKAIFLLAVPMVLELFMESLFAIVDIYFVGSLGASAVAAVGLTETYLFLLYSFAIGLSMGVTAIVARRIGEKELEKAGTTSLQAILIGIIFSIPFSIAGLFYSRELLSFMGADEKVLTEGSFYIQWALGGNVVIMLLFILNAVFRGVGDPAIAMKVLWISNGVNIILDPILIYGFGFIPALGLEGASIATIIGRGIGVVSQMWVLFHGSQHLQIVKKKFFLKIEIIYLIIQTSIGGIAQVLIGTSSWIFIMRILAEFGSEVIAGATIALRIMMFTMLPAWGLSNAVATMVGQNLGAGNLERAEKSVWITGFWNMGYLLFVAIIYFLFCEKLIEFFSSDAKVISIGSEWLKIVSYSYFVYAWWMVSAQAFNGAGDTMTPTKINLVFFWILQIPLCYILGKYFELAQTGVFWGIFFTETSVGLFTLWLFSKGKWKEFKV